MMLFVTYALNFLLMIVLPLLLGWWLARRYGLAWRLFAMGGITFILSQMFHIPFNYGLSLVFKQGLLPKPPEQWQVLFNALVFGLSAALFEEIARYLMLRYGLKDARSWKQALMFGAGHGGVEAILLGVLAGIAYVNMIVLRDNPAMLGSLPADQMQLAQQQISAYWDAPLYTTVLGAVERIFALAFHLSAAVLVMQVFLRGQMRWLGLAILWHWILDGLAVYGASNWGVLKTEGSIGIMAVLSLGIIFALRSPATLLPAEPEPDDGAAELPSSLPPASETPNADLIERSRYSE